MRVVVAIATRERSDGLRRAVRSVLDQQLPPHVELVPVVVVNGEQPLDAPIAGVRTVHEPRIGIPFARNRAVLTARAVGADALAFLDDDEVAPQGWLSSLIDALQGPPGADIATGPVVRRFPAGTPTFIRKHPIFANEPRRRGRAAMEAYTNNVLFTAPVLASEDLIFSERLAMTGGSDTELSRRLAASGFGIVWVPEAAVYEDVSEKRASVAWLLRRSVRIGANRVQRLRLATDHRARTRGAVEILGAVIEAPAGLVGALLWPISRRAGLWFLGRGARALGVVRSLTGRDPQPYRAVE